MHGYGEFAGQIFKFLFSLLVYYVAKWGNTLVSFFLRCLSHLVIKKWGAHLKDIYKYAMNYYSLCLFAVNPSKVDYTHSNILKTK